jgi:predicted nicotinamide N-methyase
VLARKLARNFIIEREIVRLGKTEITMIRPRSADELIDEDQFCADERMPYWAELWPSARVLAGQILARQGKGELLELGCGVGLVSIAAMIAGFDVLATDYEPSALDFTRANALANTAREPRTLLLDWRAVPADFPTFDQIVAAVVLYEIRYGQIVASALARLLSASGHATIADPGRISSPAFLERLTKAGLKVAERTTVPYERDGVHQRITLYTIVRR